MKLHENIWKCENSPEILEHFFKLSSSVIEASDVNDAHEMKNLRYFPEIGSMLPHVQRGWLIICTVCFRMLVMFLDHFQMKCLPTHNLRTWFLVRWKTLLICLTIPKIQSIFSYKRHIFSYKRHKFHIKMISITWLTHCNGNLYFFLFVHPR